MSRMGRKSIFEVIDDDRSLRRDGHMNGLPVSATLRGDPSFTGCAEGGHLFIAIIKFRRFFDRSQCGGVSPSAEPSGQDSPRSGYCPERFSQIWQTSN
jgi:hypothetical protein